MPLDTRTLPGKISKGKEGDAVASGWCIVAFDIVGHGQALEEWRGEMRCETPEEAAAAAKAGGDLYLHLSPYGGVFEPWHGPVSVEPVGPENDPDGKRLRLRPAGSLIRTH